MTNGVTMTGVTTGAATVDVTVTTSRTTAVMRGVMTRRGPEAVTVVAATLTASAPTEIAMTDGDMRNPDVGTHVTVVIRGITEIVAMTVAMTVVMTVAVEEQNTKMERKTFKKHYFFSHQILNICFFFL
eukprot:PhM_4_TR5045/c0_g1_i1/m.76510